MEVPDVWVLWAVLIVIAMALGWYYSVVALWKRLRAAKSLRQSQATRHGQTLEQFAPFLENWPWDPKQFRFLGTPVDGVQFNEDGIVFVEIKAGRSRLHPNQAAIRDHIAAGRVRFQEVRLDGEAVASNP